MAPSLIDTRTQASAPDAAPRGPIDYKQAFNAGPRGYNAEQELKGTGKQPPATYPNYLPTWDFSKKYEPLVAFEHHDPGMNADPAFPNLLEGATVDQMTGTIGAEVRGVQLSKLDKNGKDELALFTALNKIVVFRDQDFAAMPVGDAVEYGRYFGRLHIHPTSGAPAGYPEVHLVHRGANDTTASKFFEDRTHSTTWHTDVSYEKQPPGTTFLYVLDGPSAGGDTLFCNMAEAYNRLSPAFQERLHGLKAIHSAHEQAQLSTTGGGLVRRDPVTSVHPLVRTHPVTGEKALYINPQFTRRIVGFKKEESDFLLKFLFDHIALSQDIQCRAKWAPGTVVVWDNRVTSHSATLDWHDGQRRHIARVTPQAEAPFETPFGS